MSDAGAPSHPRRQIGVVDDLPPLAALVAEKAERTPRHQDTIMRDVD
jgi:hypothetical protein